MLEKLAGIEERYEEINRLMLEAGDDYQRAAELNMERSELEPLVEKTRTYRQILAHLEEARHVLDNEEDLDLRMLAEAEISDLEPKLARLEAELKNMLLPKDPRDTRNVIMEIRAGTGGDEAALFAADLFRMYTRFAEERGWRQEIISESRNEAGGFKEIIFELHGDGVHGLMKYESGVHRVQRVPTTEKQGRIHTSTATVAVLPKIEESDFVLNPDDLKIEATTSSGHGGQSVNTTYSAIRITHLPTGITVSCQDERSQKQNRLRAMEVIRARVYDFEQQKKQAELSERRRGQIGTGERSEKIRTYNWPQDRVTDHRIKKSWHGLNAIIDGKIEDLINAVKLAREEKTT